MLKEQTDSISYMKNEIKEYKNKFVIMKEDEFQFLMRSFLS